MKLLRSVVILMSLWVCFSVPALAESNPFLKRHPAQAPASAPALNTLDAPANAETAWGLGLRRWLEGTQYQMNQELATRVRAAQSGSAPGAWLALMLLAFAYGAFHSLGPGHGKCLICSFFVAEQASWRQGLLLGYLVAIVHALSALGVVTVLYWLLRSSSQVIFDDAARLTGLVGYGLVIMMGCWLLWRALKPAAAASTAECTEADCDHHHQHQPVQPQTSGLKRLLPMALAIGLIPCPGALTILLFSISLDFIQLGVVLAGMMALGMGLTTTLMAALTIGVRRGAFAWISRQSSGQRAEKWLRVSGACLTLTLGSLLLFLSW